MMVALVGAWAIGVLVVSFLAIHEGDDALNVAAIVLIATLWPLIVVAVLAGMLFFGVDRDA